MTNEFERFREWFTDLNEDGYRGIKENAPKEIRDAAKKADQEYYERIGRHYLHIDY